MKMQFYSGRARQAVHPTTPLAHVQLGVQHTHTLGDAGSRFTRNAAFVSLNWPTVGS